MTEPSVIELNKDGDFDGVSPMHADPRRLHRLRAALLQGQRARTGGPHRLDALRAVLSDASPKLVGLASSSFNPQSVARVISVGPDGHDARGDRPDAPTCSTCSSSRATDRLAITHMEGGRAQVVLIVNELNEGDNVQYALGHETPRAGPAPALHPRDRGALRPEPNGCRGARTSSSTRRACLLVTTENNTGPIPTSQLSSTRAIRAST
jgi:hypothetical protein